MEFLKFALVIFAGLGIAWAAGAVVPTRQIEDTSRLVVAQAKTTPDSAEMEEARTSPDSEDVVVDLEEISQEDIDAELAKIEAALESGEELEEFKPAESLPADLRLHLPSDI